MSLRRRRVISALAAVVLLGSFHWAARAAHPPNTLRHVGPVGLAANQEAIVSVANPTNAPVTATVTLFDANAQVLARQPLTVAPKQSGIVSWAAASATQIRATVTTPGSGPSPYPIALLVYDAGSDKLALALQANSSGQAITTATGPYVPPILAAYEVLRIVNLGVTAATYTVQFFDGDGALVSTQSLPVAPRHIGAVQAPAPQPKGLRVEVRGPGTPALISNEIVDEATGKTIAVILGY